MSEIEKYDVNPEQFKHFRTVRDSSTCKLGVDILRCDIKNGNDAKLWVEEYSKITQTEWIVEKSVIKPQRSDFCKWWCCQHASKKKKLFGNSRCKNTNCKARINIIIKKMTTTVVLRDFFLQGPEPLRGVVKLHAAHNHPVVTSGESEREGVRVMRASRHVRLMFEDYFSRGLAPSSAKRLHESKLSMEENASDLLADLSVNPLDRTVQYWYTSWRKLDYKKQVDSSSEMASSARPALLWEAVEGADLDESQTDLEQWPLEDDDNDKEGSNDVSMTPEESWSSKTIAELESEEDEVLNSTAPMEELHSADNDAVTDETHEKKSSLSSQLFIELTKPLNHSTPATKAKPHALPVDHSSIMGMNGNSSVMVSCATSSSSTDKLAQTCSTMTQCSTSTVLAHSVANPTPATLPSVPNYHLILGPSSLTDKPSPVFNTFPQTDKNVQMPESPLYHLIINSQCSINDKSLQVSKPLDSRPNMAGNNITTLPKAMTSHSSASNLEIKCLPPLILHTEKSATRQNTIGQSLPETSGMDKLMLISDGKTMPPNSPMLGLLPMPSTTSASKTPGLQNLLLVQFPPSLLPPPQASVQKGQPPQPQLLLLQSPVPPSPLGPAHAPRATAPPQPRLILVQMPQGPVQSPPSAVKPVPVAPVPPLISINRVGQVPSSQASSLPLMTSSAAPLMCSSLFQPPSSQVSPLPLVTSSTAPLMSSSLFQPPSSLPLVTSSAAPLMSTPLFQVSSGEQQQPTAERTVLLPDSNMQTLDMLNFFTGQPGVGTNTSLSGLQSFGSSIVNVNSSKVDLVTKQAARATQPDAEVVGIASELVRIQKLCKNPATLEKTVPKIVQCLKKIRTPKQAANALFRIDAALSVAMTSCRKSVITRAVRRSCRMTWRKNLSTDRKHKDRRKKKESS
ncbi:uncharacterized protein LOC134538335 [Bacillus rossius redtenbacheri]|uniref:uncharacterized protein LOC134538335 n=1 Tax=Bacillus rossius redtenbacheri TaxID=93214 RepID=UPI002FDEADE3